MSTSNQNNVLSCEQLSFDQMPTEVKFKIFKLLNLKSFLTCRSVSHDWKDLIDSLQDDVTWIMHLKETLPKYLMYIQKGKLPIYKILKDIASWDTQKKITISEMPNTQVHSFHIYRDSIIAICIDFVKYYNADTFVETKRIYRDCYDFNESDHMQVEITRTSVLHVYGKTHENSFLENGVHKYLGSENGIIYKLYRDKIFFIVKGRDIYSYQWYKTDWYASNFLSRMYDSDVICDINIWGEDIWVITECGKLFSVDWKLIKLKLINRFEMIGPQVSYRLFDKCSTLSHAGGSEEVIEIYDNVEGIFLAVPEATVMLEHGDLLVLAGGNQLELSSISSLKSSQEYEPLQLAWDVRSGTIVSMDIYESEHAQILFVLTDCKLIKFIISRN